MRLFLSTEPLASGEFADACPTSGSSHPVVRLSRAIGARIQRSGRLIEPLRLKSVLHAYVGAYPLLELLEVFESG